MPITACAYGVQHSNPTQPSFPFALIITVNEHPPISKGSKKVFFTTMKKHTKKSPKEVHQSDSPSPTGSSEGGLSRLKSKLKTFVNKFSHKLSSKPPSRSTSHGLDLLSCQVATANSTDELLWAIFWCVSSWW